MTNRRRPHDAEGHPPNEGAESSRVNMELVNFTADIGMNQFLEDLSRELRLMPEGRANKALALRYMIDEYMKNHEKQLDPATIRRYNRIRKGRFGG